MELRKKHFIIITGFLEALLFSGCLFGWPSLLLILQEEGVYQHLCNTDFNKSFNLSDEALPKNVSAYEKKSAHYKASSQESPDSANDETIRQRCEGNCSSTISWNLNNSQDYPETFATGCDNQRIEMTLIYTFAAVIYGITAVFIGMSLDYFGLRVTRLIGSTFACLGFLFLAYTSKDKSYLLWPALNLIGLGTNMLRFSGFQYADLMPEFRATVITTYSSAYSISTTFFLLMQIIYEATVAMRLIFLCCVIMCVLTYFPTFLLPKMKIDKVDSNETSRRDKTIQSDEATDLIQCKLKDEAAEAEAETQDSGLTKQSEKAKQDSKDIETDTNTVNNYNGMLKEAKGETEVVPGPKSTSVYQSLWSTSGVLHIYWQFINLLLVLFYSSTFNIWAGKVTDDIEQISFFIKMSGLCCFTGPLFIPIIGYVTDRMIYHANKLQCPIERLAYTMRAPTFAMASATLLLAMTMICKMFVNETAIYVSLILIALSRPAVVGSCTSYIRLRFPSEQFNILNGVFTTIISILCFVQYPIMKWMTTSNQAYLEAHWLLTGLLIGSLASPGHMMFRKNILFYAKQRMKMETDN